MVKKMEITVLLGAKLSGLLQGVLSALLANQW